MALIICPYCESQIDASSSSCMFCGAPLSSALKTQVVQDDAETNAAEPENTDASCEVILKDLGTCERATCNDLLEDLMGYSDGEAERLINNIPVRIAYMMTRTQAKALAQALTEHGCEIAVVDGDENVDFDDEDDDDITETTTDEQGNLFSSSFNKDGSLVKKALLVLAGITAVNKVTSYNSYKKTGLLQRLFSRKTAKNTKSLYTGTDLKNYTSAYNSQQQLPKPTHIRQPLHNIDSYHTSHTSLHTGNKSTARTAASLKGTPTRPYTDRPSTASRTASPEHTKTRRTQSGSSTRSLGPSKGSSPQRGPGGPGGPSGPGGPGGRGGSRPR